MIGPRRLAAAVGQLRCLLVLVLALVLGSMAAASPGARAESPDAVARFVQQTLGLSSFRRGEADLNGDGKPEVFIYVTDPARCGSGGCNLYILSPRREGFRVVLRSTITRPPITLLETSTREWRDVGVTVSGGGIRRPYMARLRFDGERYPGNPTVAPALPLDQPSGAVLIGP